MPIDLFLHQPALGVAWIFAILFALAVHEAAHAGVSALLGDDTAVRAGRLTLNPLAHVDLLGLFMLLIVGFGWGQPVPFEPSRLRFRRWGSAMVAVAGPLANLVLLGIAVGMMVVLTRMHLVPGNNLLLLFLAYLVQINLVLALFNVLPIPPLDGSKLLFGLLDHPRYERFRTFLELQGPFLLLGLLVVDGLLHGAILGRFFHAALQWAIRLME
ncbi:site-2 protease family protein [Candidatus Uhrbacteria bacterium]|nr:site-2 protease family protein [Candidatus Uhrbacteria bacterium]